MAYRFAYSCSFPGFCITHALPRAFCQTQSRNGPATSSATVTDIAKEPSEVVAAG
jgi:hypothetical protein